MLSLKKVVDMSIWSVAQGDIRKGQQPENKIKSMLVVD